MMSEFPNKWNDFPGVREQFNKAIEAGLLADPLVNDSFLESLRDTVKRCITLDDGKATLRPGQVWLKLREILRERSGSSKVYEKLERETKQALNVLTTGLFKVMVNRGLISEIGLKM